MHRPTDSPVITLKFGATSPPYSQSSPHQGVDYRARPEGRNVYAPHAGKITLTGTQGACGKAVDIDGGRFKSRLCHNSVYKVSVGQQVSEGQLVALSGATSNVPISPHVHWVLWDNGTRVDGSKYITEEEEMVTKELMDKVWPLITYDGKGPTQADYDVWVGKKDLNTLIVYKIIPELQGHATVNPGDLVNYFRKFVGHDPTAEDKKVWEGVAQKNFIYNKAMKY